MAESKFLNCEFNGKNHSIELEEGSGYTLENLFELLRQKYGLDDAISFEAVTPGNNKISDNNTPLWDLFISPTNGENQPDYDLEISLVAAENSEKSFGQKAIEEIKKEVKASNRSGIKIQPVGTMIQEVMATHTSYVYSLPNDSIIIHTNLIPIIKNGLQPSLFTHFCFIVLGAVIGATIAFLVPILENRSDDLRKGLYVGVFCGGIVCSLILSIIMIVYEKKQKKVLDSVLIQLDGLDQKKTNDSTK